MGYRFQNSGATAELYIYGDIGWWGTTANQFRADLQSTGTKPLMVHIASNGGDVIDAMAIYTLLATRKNTTTRVDALAASSASIIAQAGATREIVANGWMMIHEPIVAAAGNEQAMRSAANGLSAIKQTIIDTYAKRSGQTPEAISALMAAETWYTAQEAKDAGLADTVVDPFEVQNSVKLDLNILSKFRHTPAAVVTAYGLPPQEPNNDATLMSKMSEFLNSFKPAPAGPSEREQKLFRMLAKADIDPEPLLAAEGDDGLHRLIEAAITNGSTAEKTQREKAETTRNKIVAALKASGVEVDEEKLDTLEASITARVENVASRKMVTLAAARGIAPIATEAGQVNGGTAAAKTYTQECVETHAQKN